MSFSEDFKYRDCPWCGTKSVQMSIEGDTRKIRNSKNAHREWTWLSCPRCAGVISLETAPNSRALLEVIPKHTTEVDVNHLPENVEEYYRNAIIVLNTGVASAAAVELRRTLEAAAQHRGITERPLVRAIEKMAEGGLITKDFSPVLAHIKKIGNAGAHATDEPVTEQEVRVALRFTTQVLRNLFEIPKELEILNNPPAEEVVTPVPVPTVGPNNPLIPGSSARSTL